MMKLYEPSGSESRNMIKPKLSLIFIVSVHLKRIKIFIVQYHEAALYVCCRMWISGC